MYLKRGFSHVILINTPLQRGVPASWGQGNRFNGFNAARETVETVGTPTSPRPTPLKRGVNERDFSSPCQSMKNPVQTRLMPRFVPVDRRTLERVR